MRMKERQIPGDALNAWFAETARLAPEIIRDPVATALRYIAEQVFADKDAEISRLRAELAAVRSTALLSNRQEDR